MLGFKRTQQLLIISCSTQPITKTSKFSLPQFSQQSNKTILKKILKKKIIITKKKKKNRVNQTIISLCENSEILETSLVDSIYFCIFLFGVEFL